MHQEDLSQKDNLGQSGTFGQEGKDDVYHVNKCF